MKLQPHELTFIAEALGKRQPPPLRWLITLARHASPLVREGVIYGLAPHARLLGVRDVLRTIAEDDKNLTIRECAREVIENEDIS